MLGHGGGVSQFPQFYDKIKKRSKFLSRPYAGSYLGEKGHNFFNKHGLLH